MDLLLIIFAAAVVMSALCIPMDFVVIFHSLHVYCVHRIDSQRLPSFSMLGYGYGLVTFIGSCAFIIVSWSRKKIRREAHMKVSISVDSEYSNNYISFRI